MGIKGKIPQRDVLYIPMYYKARWAIELNRIMNGSFTSLGRYKEGSLGASRKMIHTLYAKELGKFHKYGGILFSNLLRDFTSDVCFLTSRPKLWGFVHSITGIENPTSEWVTPYDRGVMEVVDKVLCATELVAGDCAGNPVVVGLPVHGRRHAPKLESNIIWNHRVFPGGRYKNWRAVRHLPETLKRRLIFTSSNYSAEVDKTLGGTLAELHFRPPPDVYNKLFDRSGYVLHTGERDAFSYSVIEGVWAGMFAFGKKDPPSGFSEYLPEEMTYIDFGDLEEKLNFYDSHPDIRTNLVRRAQENLRPLQPQPWLDNLMSVLGVEG